MRKPVRLEASVQNADAVLRIEFAAPGCLARRVVSRSNMRTTGRFPSFRMKRHLCWDSPAELNLFRLLDCDPSVLEFREQPCTVYFRLAGVEHRHVPDCYVRRRDSKTLVEVKTTADSRRPEIAERTELLTAQCPHFGFDYRVALAENLRQEPQLRNARVLWRYGKTPLTFEEREYCRRLFTTAASLRWRDITDGRYGPLGLRQACRLVLEGVLRVDLGTGLDAQAVVPVAGAIATSGP